MHALAEQSFFRMSIELGTDRMLVQAAGGNTSLKQGRYLWVKASGRALADCGVADAFLPLDLDCVRSRLAGEASADPDLEVCKQVSTPSRASIETSLHALMPHRVVAHVHPINALSWLVRQDAKERLAPRLHGLDWAWCDYVRPGILLTRAVQGIQAERGGSMPGILLLGNHGVVVGCDSPEGVMAKLRDLESRLAVVPRQARTDPDPTLVGLAAEAGLKLPSNGLLHSLALDGMSFGAASRGALYPDHIVFLGSHAPAVPGGLGRAEALRRCAEVGNGAGYVLVEGAGVLLSRSTSPSAEAMLECLAQVLLRIEPEARLRFLSESEAADIAGWDAEKYRKRLA